MLYHPYLDECVRNLASHVGKHDVNRQDRGWPLPWNHVGEKNAQLFVPWLVKMRNSQIFIAERGGSTGSSVCHFRGYMTQEA